MPVTRAVLALYLLQVLLASAGNYSRGDLTFGVAQTTTIGRDDSKSKDLAWQAMASKGRIEQQTQYEQFNVATFDAKAGRIVFRLQ